MVNKFRGQTHSPENFNRSQRGDMRLDPYPPKNEVGPSTMPSFMVIREHRGHVAAQEGIPQDFEVGEPMDGQMWTLVVANTPEDPQTPDLRREERDWVLLTEPGELRKQGQSRRASDHWSPNSTLQSCIEEPAHFDNLPLTDPG